MVMFIGKFFGRKSLRGIVMNVAAQSSKLYHLAIKPCSRAILARVNEKQPAALFGGVFFKLLERCRQFAPAHRFKFKSKLYLLDAITIDLCLSLFPWATFVSFSEGKTHESNWANALKLPRGSFVVFDRGFSEDREIFLGKIPDSLRMVCYRVPETGKELRFITNADHLSAKTIADLCKERWQIEIFFKWIRQNLKVKTFLGTSKNAVLTQIWIALCVYLLLALLKPPEQQLVECRQFSLF